MNLFGEVSPRKFFNTGKLISYALKGANVLLEITSAGIFVKLRQLGNSEDNIYVP